MATRRKRPAPGDPRRIYDVRVHPETRCCALLHVNGIAVVCVSAQHALMEEGSAVVRFESKFTDRAAVGKKKRNAVMLHDDSVLGIATFADGKQVRIIRFVARCTCV